LIFAIVARLVLREMIVIVLYIQGGRTSGLANFVASHRTLEELVRDARSLYHFCFCSSASTLVRGSVAGSERMESESKIPLCAVVSERLA
jgi:hypothetical protein